MSPLLRFHARCASLLILTCALAPAARATPAAATLELPVLAVTADVPSAAAAEGGWIARRMPQWLREEMLFLELWQWFALGAVILFGLIVDRLFVALLNRVLRRMLSQAKVELEKRFTLHTLRPFGYLVMALVWVFALPSLSLPDGAHATLVVAAKFVAIASGVWGAYRLVDVFSEAMAQKAARTSSRFDDLLVPLVRKTLKVFIGAFGLVFIADNLEVDISSLLAGLGLGGLAFALAAQDTVRNLFGLMTIVGDRPFQVGDWVLIDDTEGTVEAVGFRSTRIRTFWNSRITVPNSKLLNSVVDNMGVRAYRRYKTMLSLTYDTSPERIEAFCEGIREIVRQHPYTRKDFYLVHFTEYAASALNVLVYMFFATPDWPTELRERQRFNLDVLRLAKRLGVEFAFPTQTLHLHQEEPGAALPDLPEDLQKVFSTSRQEARTIVKQGLGELGEIPPPVTFENPT